VNFRTTIPKPNAKIKIGVKDKLFFMGSCFSDQIAKICSDHFLKTITNPFGVIFHPIPLFSLLEKCLHQQNITENHLIFYENKAYFPFAHSVFSGDQPKALLQKINNHLLQTREDLINAKHLFITLGSCFAYRHKALDVLVANCHKLPATFFNKELTGLPELNNKFNSFYQALKTENPKINIHFTISPVRHLKDGMIKNNRSKARLIECCHQWVENNTNIHYFPSYELLMDDLRDYRFYNEDMIHPNKQAIQYIWEYFKSSYFDEQGIRFLAEAEKVVKLKNHTILDPSKEESQKFEEKRMFEIQKFLKKYD